MHGSTWKCFLLVCGSLIAAIHCQSNLVPTTTSASAKIQDESSKICSLRYAKFYENHTACISPNHECKINKKGVSKQEKQTIVNVHNHYRNLIASGNESRLGFGPASNMLAMVWDDELAYVAQKHANQCKFEHDCYDCRRTERFAVVGQNLYLYRTTRTSAETKWSYVIKEWYDEIEIAPPEVATSFDLFNLNIGHFTQIAWAGTNRVGCGFTTFENNELDDGENTIFKTVQLYTCNYAPGGNFLGEKMYENGPGASQCPAKWSRSKKHSSLCELAQSKPKQSTRKVNKKNKKKKSKSKSKSKSKPRHTNNNNKRTTTLPTTSTTTTTTTTTTQIPPTRPTTFAPITPTTTTTTRRTTTTFTPSTPTTTTTRRTTTTVTPSTSTTPTTRRTTTAFTTSPPTTPTTITSTTWWDIPKRTTNSRSSFIANNNNRIKTTRAPWWASYKTTRKPTWRYINNRHTTTPRISTTTTRFQPTESSFDTNRIARRNTA